MLITRKIQISIIKEDETSYQKAWNTLYYLDNTISKAANKIVSHQYFNNENNYCQHRVWQ
jgi:hypothetical protein